MPKEPSSDAGLRVRRLRVRDVWLPGLEHAQGVMGVLEGDVSGRIELLGRAARRG
jgi:hypothetical protein